MSTPLTKRPGEFRATCRQGAWLSVAQFRAYDYDLSALQSRWDHKLREEVYAVPCDLDTTDRTEYLEHMAQVHGRKPRGPAQRRLGRGMWPAKPRKADEKPFSTRAKVETCAGCGLVAEHDGSTATELWWTEHQRGCAIAQAAS